jgi:hypothetical protein
MNIRSNSPGGSVNSREVSDARSSSGASTNCNCAISAGRNVPHETKLGNFDAGGRIHVVGGRWFLVRVQVLWRIRQIDCVGFQDLLGARLQIERRLAFAEAGRILSETRQGIEHLAAPAAAHLSAGGAQRLGGQAKHGLAL